MTDLDEERSLLPLSVYLTPDQFINFSNAHKLSSHSSQSHYLLGHHFQVTAIDGESVARAVRDTVMIPHTAGMTIAFDADNPGRWPLHCHQLYHMASGMMTFVRYEGVS